MPLSTRLPFEGLNNTRDLGGMQTTEGGTVSRGKLIRSGHLHAATPADLETLSALVRVIVDFRTGRERAEKPDPPVPGTEEMYIPIFESLAAGVTRDQKSDREAFTIAARDPETARQYMMRTYTGFVTNDFSVSQYQRFLDLLLEEKDRAVLWHCTAGKDRAGFAAVIVQFLLGVHRDDILGDYLLTNDCVGEEVHALRKMAGHMIGGLDAAAEKALDYLFGAHEEFLLALYAAVKERYGDFNGFVRNGLKVTEEERDTLRRMYLE